MPSTIYATATIPVGQSVSNIIQTNQMTVNSIISGSSTSASTVTILVSNDSVTFVPLYNNISGEYSILSGSAAGGPARAYYIAEGTLDSFKAFKLRLGNSASAINQTVIDAPFIVALVAYK